MMIVHGTADEGQLLLWGETPAAVETQRGRKPEETHPCPAPTRRPALSAALAEALPGAMRRADREQVLLWLPTVKDQPVAFQPADRRAAGRQDESHLAPWGVTAFPPVCRRRHRPALCLRRPGYPRPRAARRLDPRFLGPRPAVRGYPRCP